MERGKQALLQNPTVIKTQGAVTLFIKSDKENKGERYVNEIIYNRSKRGS
jgi:hypothetical protein